MRLRIRKTRSRVIGIGCRFKKINKLDWKKEYKMADGKTAMVQGRIVWVAGDLFKGQVKTIFGTNQPQLDQKTGEKQVQYGFGLAVPKSELADPNRGGPLWTAMHEEAWTLYPSRQIPPSFAMKFKDGDGVDDQGRPFSSREGYQGCLVFALTTQLPIRFFKWENGQNVQISDGIKCGDYCNVQVSIKGHAAHGPGKAGLFLNPMAVQLVAPGKEIFNAPSGDQVFGLAAPPPPSNYVPPDQPTAPPVAAVPAAPAMPGAPPVAYQAPQGAAPVPHYGVVPPAFQPPAGGVPTAPVMPPPPR